MGSGEYSSDPELNTAVREVKAYEAIERYNENVVRLGRALLELWGRFHETHNHLEDEEPFPRKDECEECGPEIGLALSVAGIVAICPDEKCVGVMGGEFPVCWVCAKIWQGTCPRCGSPSYKEWMYAKELHCIRCGGVYEG